MAQLKLTANTPSEQRILEYLQNNASETLAEKINNGTPFEKDGKPLTNKKSLSGFMKYACGMFPPLLPLTFRATIKIACPHTFYPLFAIYDDPHKKFLCICHLLI